MKNSNIILINKTVMALFFILFLINTSLFSQTTNDDRIKALPKLITEAANSGAYQKAANLKKEKELREQIKIALAANNYQKASELQKEISGLSDSKSSENPAIVSLEKELKEALKNEDYKKASDLKKQIESLKNGGSIQKQTSDSATLEPEFINQVVYFNKLENKITPLENGTAEMKVSSMSAPGFAKATSYYIIKGEHSNVNLNANNNPSFIAKIAPALDPKDYLYMVKYEIKGKKEKDRYVEAFTTKAGMFGGGSTEKNEKQRIPISFTKIKDGLYEIKPESTLGNGEYAIVFIANKMFSFSIN